MFPDDVFREHLGEAIAALESWAAETKDTAQIDIDNSETYWKMAVTPHAHGACPFEVLFDSHQRFSLALADEIYEDRPVDRFDFFLMLARAVASGNVERIRTFNAMTDAAEMIEMRVVLEDGWAWVGERRIAPRTPRKLETASVRRVERFLPYRR
jgi:hypothetical protein